MTKKEKKAPLRIAIVAGEISGDILGAGFMRAIKDKHPDAQFVGIGGPKMQAEGCESLFELEALSVMGLVEVLGRLPQLLEIKRTLVAHFCACPPDVFVGIDAPDFNLRLEKTLKARGIKTVQYVSPSVWAWRQGRIHGIAKATNLVLALLPFEKAFYDKFNVPCEFVGHTLADDIPMISDKHSAKKSLGLALERPYLAVLPGSRGGEMKRLAPVFIKTCQELIKTHPELGFVVALVNQKRRQEFEQIWRALAPELDFVLIDDTARQVITASDAVLLASGTVALETMLIKRPSVVAYKMNALTAWLVRKMLKTPFVALPNILAGRELVPERLQEACEPKILAADIRYFLEHDNKALMDEFISLHQSIRCDADKAAASAVLRLIGRD